METIQILGYLFLGAATVSITGITIYGLVSESRDRKMMPILNRQYGPQLRDNLGKLEAAVETKDYGLAKMIVEERKNLLQEMEAIRPSYARLVSTEVKAYLAQGNWLEERVGKL